MPLFQIIADLHLETHTSYSDYKLPLTDAPYIALLGDIGHVCDSALFDFFRELVKHYWAVFFLLGNHEPYQITVFAAKSRVRAFEKQMAALHAGSNLGKFVFLDQTRHDLDATTSILGCTLYSHVPETSRYAVGSRMVDFKVTRSWSVDDHNAAHSSDLAWLNAQVNCISAAEPERQIVVFTHHSPTIDPRANDAKHKGSEMNAGFVTDLGAEPCWRSRNVRLWAYGHTHYACDFVDEATGKKVLSNPKGYWRNPKVTGKPSRVYFDARLMYDLPDGRTIKPSGNDVEDVENDSQKLKRAKSKGGLWKKITSSFGRH